ncbi:AAA family ATPase [Gloeothece verrucosa]|uniref:AAA ATPase n=1 Tax=Gloeothece verrucosa (strain PCC 7822) TaxID=497965 RepID=E0UGL4_GLOV7|nr:AAA family ATPase [Gloeothece verrucosa]ADN13223.1 AAA ATPase [Gloeothece verrucosa PCC 7822]
MGRSLKVSQEYISRVKSSLQRNGYPSQQALADDAGFSLSTVKNFLNGKPIDHLNFIELCEKLGLDWQEISKTELISDDISLENSPFITGTPITHPRYFFGREKEVKRLFNLLKRHPLQNAAIIGKRRSGKTSLLHYLKTITTTPVNLLRPAQKSDWLRYPEHYQWVFVDFQDSRMASQEYLLRHILEGLEISLSGDCNLDRFMDIVSSKLNTFSIILMDEIGTALDRYSQLDDDFWSSLRSLGTNQTRGKLAFILAAHESPIELSKNTGHDSPFFNIFGYTTVLGALTETEALELINSSPISFAQEDIEWILERSQCHPFLLQILCREKLWSLEDGEIAEDWKEEGLREINPYLYLL